jgi:membrane protein implicated in regulation of membrane protease activity
MDHLLAALTAFPTVLFTPLLAVAVLYWLLVILGALDMDLFHLGDGDVGSHDAHAGHNSFAILEFLRVGQVPITVIASAFIVIAWIVSLAATMFLRPAVPEWSWWLFAIVALGGSLVLAYLGTGLLGSGLARVFTIRGTVTATSMVGRVVEVTSSSVDARYGTARHDRLTGEDILLNVVCDPAHTLKRGDQAVIMDYDRAQGVYLIAPLPHTREGFAVEAEQRPTLPPPAGAAEPAAPSADSPAPSPGRRSTLAQ